MTFNAANNKGIVYDFGTATVVRNLPDLPGGVRSYPLTKFRAYDIFGRHYGIKRVCHLLNELGLKMNGVQA
jgi:hypothetical protein